MTSRFMEKRNDNYKGFTLVEIMVVVLVIAILTGFLIPNLLRAKMEANDASARATLRSIGTALETYMGINHAYPPDTTSLLGASPPYLNTDYFAGTHNGFTFSASLSGYAYTITASPLTVKQSGSTTFTLVTGGVLQ